MRQIVMGLEELHRMGYCHRDLKPENILIARKGVVKLADFGLAGMLSKQLVKSCGSPIYAAPEMMRRKPYDGTRSDVWSCGVVLYAMVVGSLPFDSV
jgi:serine/threonine protein kinase